MSDYKPRKLRPLRVIAFCLRSLAVLLRVWPLLFIVALLLFPKTPHLRVHYSYELHGHRQVMIECTYLGVRGKVRTRIGNQCPIITLIHPL